MRLRNFVVAVFCLALAVPAFASAQRQDADKVTGGGQVLVSTNVPGGEGAGPGDTLGFVAISTSSNSNAAGGQFQFVRTSEAGRTMEILGANVLCLEVHSSNTATFGGQIVRERNGQGGGSFFVADVVEADSQGNDIIEWRRETNNPCDDLEENEDAEAVLARGKLKVHQAG